MLKRKKREFHSSELMQSFAKMYGFENKLLALEMNGFLLELIDREYQSEIKSVNIQKDILLIQIQSPLFKNDFKFRKSYYLNKIQEEFGEDSIMDIHII